MNIMHSGFSLFTPGQRAVPVDLETANRLGLCDSSRTDSGAEDTADFTEFLREHVPEA